MYRKFTAISRERVSETALKKARIDTLIDYDILQEKYLYYGQLLFDTLKKSVAFTYTS
jgi:hypothetical protein